jgi:hypothetical protein
MLTYKGLRTILEQVRRFDHKTSKGQTTGFGDHSVPTTLPRKEPRCFLFWTSKSALTSIAHNLEFENPVPTNLFRPGFPARCSPRFE